MGFLFFGLPFGVGGKLFELFGSFLAVQGAVQKEPSHPSCNVNVRSGRADGAVVGGNTGDNDSCG